MAWPPTIPPNNRTNDTALTDAHPSDHNVTANALSDLVAKVNTNTSAIAALPLGLVVKPYTPAQVTLTTAVQVVATVTIAGKAGRSYRVGGFIYYSTGGTANTVSQQALDVTPNTIIGGGVVSLAAFYQGTIPVDYVFACGAADRSMTIQVRAAAGTNGTGAKNEAGHVYAEDVGPTPP